MLSFIFIILASVMLIYLARHYIFTLTALYYRPGQPCYTPHGLVITQPYQFSFPHTTKKE